MGVFFVWHNTVTYWCFDILLQLERLIFIVKYFLELSF